MFQQNIALGPGTEAFSSHLIEVIIMLLGAAILGFIIGWLFRKSYKQEFFGLKAEHDPCSGIKAGLEQNIANLTSDLEKSQSLVVKILNEKDELNANLKARISDLDMANQNITVKESEIVGLKNQLVNLSESIDKSHLRLQSLEAEKISLSDEIMTLKEKLSKPLPESAASVSASLQPDMQLAAKMLGRNYKLNDLKLIEGIGPKIEELFHRAGIKTWDQLASANESVLKHILDEGGEQFRLHDPSTWPQQAKLAAAGLWKELKELQDHLQGGRK